ncbi:phage major capsid protein [Zunongwangia profunda]|uniref:phage major capsid protein n=1 Tax=Zunongwangia profunda TaxID=398743 RepID=UPI00248EDCE4|nr:phage major capsid protein [Zunongwangia profunda]|tara:strand:- start:11696 stop:13087 length:1392 start_codon:yes stop_codon:yes gene_type:complete
MKNRNKPFILLFAATGNKLAELRQKRAEKLKAQKSLIDKRSASDEKQFTEEQSKEFRDLNTEISNLDSQIEEEEAVVESEKRNAALNGKPVDGQEEDIDTDKRGGKGPKGEEAERRSILKQFSIKRAIEMQLDHRSLDGAEKETDDIAKEELRSQGLAVPGKGFNVPSDLAFRADSHTVTQDGGDYGGNLVREMQGELLPTFVDRLSIEDLGVTIKRGLTGDYPLNRGSEFEFQNLGETDKVSPQKAKYDKRVLKPKRTALNTAISYQLLAQSAFNVQQDINQRIDTALDKRLMLDMLNGSGANFDPLGLLNDPDIAFIFSGAEGPLTLDKILEMEAAVDDENVPGEAIFLIHKKLAAIAKAIRVDAGSGIMLMDKSNELYGTQTRKTSLLPVLSGTADNYPLIYGDFANVYGGFWGGLNFTFDPYTQADSNEVRMIVNVHRDIMAANPEGFAINKKLTLSAS